ncbi:hypothetical protein SGADD02_00028 [Streptococcus gallolyticus]|uniref:Uncharacterized protein n=1 Tax=Streptococcus gallolyticus TaxID=315405 RepID=A0A139NDM5_9STRE|nr:hypothetical protein SGADD02_00028 [Streptococcus gallolyticus]
MKKNPILDNFLQSFLFSNQKYKIWQYFCYKDYKNFVIAN